MTEKKKKRLQKIQKLVKGFFKNADGKPYEMTYGQANLFLKVINPNIKWLWMSAPTRYGKSEILAMALIYLAVVKKIKIPIVAGSEDKAKKIMQYVLQHLGDHEEFYKGLINLDLSEVDKLKVSMSKDTIRWADGGWIFVTSVDSRNISKEGEGVVGEGGDVIILEEAGLIKRDEQFSKIVRMREENRGWGKLIMSGNCVEGSVFEKAYKNPLYKKVRITLDQAIEEGRYTREFVEETKSQTTGKDWKRYWLVIFPDRNESAYFKPRKYDILPPNLKVYGAIDPALGDEGKEAKKVEHNEEGSKIGIIVLGMDEKGKLYELESIIEHMGPDDAIRKIFNLPFVFKKFVFEAVMFQRYFLKIVREKSRELGLQIPFDGINQSRNKIERIESLEPFINNGDILFKGDNQLWDDLLDYPHTKKLDGLDALEMAYRASGRRKAGIGIGGQMF